MIASSRDVGGKGGVGSFAGKRSSCTPMYRIRPSFFNSRRAANCVAFAAADTMARSILDTLNLASFSSTCAFTPAASSIGGGPAGTDPRDGMA
jgi:hypothetical protein